MNQIRLVIHAPNVHTGGGLALLKELVATHCIYFSWAHLDDRTKDVLKLAVAVTQYHVRPSILSRLLAELRLWRNVTIDDVVLCFHGLPPLLPLSGRAVVFVQNRILVEQGSLVDYPLQTRLRLLIERFWLRAMKGHATRYIVQTPSMAASLRTLLGDEVEICVLPFASLNMLLPTEKEVMAAHKFDFLYVASGDAHKNHTTLLEAWRLLAEAGLKPSLALTVDPLRHPSIHAEISRVANEYSLKIINLGQLSSDEVADLYQSSSALIYPSKTESFGFAEIDGGQ
jgi:glycosyltransferase involved in cell wall biosynthesis